jgi:hypothetical protein
VVGGTAVRAGPADDWPRTTRLLPWALFAFLAMLWMVPFDSIFLPAGLPIDMTVDRPLLVGLAGVILLGAGTAKRERRRFSPIHWAFGAFLAIATLSVLARGEALVRVGELELAVKQLALLTSYAVFFASAAVIIRPREISRLLTATVVLACVTAVAVIVEYRFGTNPFHDWIGPLFPGYVKPEGLGSIDAIGRKQIFGPTAQPLAAAVMLSIALPLAFARLLAASGRRRTLYALAVVLLIGGAVATQKKTSLVGPAICVLVLLAYRPREMARLAPLALLLVPLVHLTMPGALGSVVDQFSPDSVTRVNTTKDRVADYSAVKPDLVSRPLIGRGYGSYDQKRHRILDNEYLGLGISVGLLGVLAYLAIFATSFLSAHRAARSEDPERAPPGLAIAAAILVALAGGAILDFLSFPQLPYLLCFIAAIAFVLGRERIEAEAA